MNEINKIPKDEFSKMLHSWMENEEVKKAIEGQVRQSLIQKFIDMTALGKKMDQLEKRKKSFDPRTTILTSMEAEHLYCNKLFFTLSVFSTETQQPIPDFESENFRFEKREIQEYLQVLGLMKDDYLVKHIVNIYNSHTHESLLLILIKSLIASHKRVSVESKTTSTQTDENNEKIQDMDISQISQRSTRSRKKAKNHSLVSATAASSTTIRNNKGKSKKSKGIALIANSLDLMSQNINVITNKLEDFQKSPSHDDSKSIILETVGVIMHQLNGCVTNFERLCDDIKAINDDKQSKKDYDEWISDLKHSENGKKFLKKFSKSFTKLLDEERLKIRKEYQLKFERDKRKLAKFYNTSSKFKNIPSTAVDSKLSKDINEIFESTALKLKNIEHETEAFEKSVKLDIYAARQRQEDLKPEITQCRKVDDLDLNKCRQIHSKESSSINTNPHSYSSASFEDIISETNI